VLIGSSSLSMGDRVATPLGADRPASAGAAAMLSALLDRQAGWRPPLAGPADRLRCSRWRWRCWRAIRCRACRPPPTPRCWPPVRCCGWRWPSAGAARPRFLDRRPLLCLFLLAVAVPFRLAAGAAPLAPAARHAAPVRGAKSWSTSCCAATADPLAPRQLDVTTLIADMEGYTSQVERCRWKRRRVLTRDFLDCLTGPVLAQRGTLDKYTGDGLVAFWGAPLPNADHADLALDAAARILRAWRASAAREAQRHAAAAGAHRHRERRRDGRRLRYFASAASTRPSATA
jgi:adenylate cyclase